MTHLQNKWNSAYKKWEVKRIMSGTERYINYLGRMQRKEKKESL